MEKSRLVVPLFIWLCLSLALVGCGDQQRNRTVATSPAKVFLPPTPDNQIPSLYMPTNLPESESATPFDSLSAPNCQNDLRFIQDITIPDGSVVPAGELIDKRWLVENSGTCNWSIGYQLVLIETTSSEVPAQQALYPARRGTQALIRLLFRAPTTAGTQRSAWRATSPNGEAFGDVIYIEVIISEGN